MATLVIIYMSESFILPPLFGHGEPVLNAPPTEIRSSGNSQMISIEQVLRDTENSLAVNFEDKVIDQIAYLPQQGLYRLSDTQNFLEWYIDSGDETLVSYGFRSDIFLEEKGLLGWLSPWVHQILEFPFLFLMATLAVSGIYLFVQPFIPARRNAEPS
ncbi:MAG: hypothetical protein IGQ88_07145 [Gloeomargaritaceae cyanobacterium C42_A2020_066]|nr:hypothetical protein [Gloeomargaritaceae cyanobacterium C42_A2020_066]